MFFIVLSTGDSPLVSCGGESPYCFKGRGQFSIVLNDVGIFPPETRMRSIMHFMGQQIIIRLSFMSSHCSPSCSVT